MNSFHVFRFVCLFLTSITALYLFGTRGHSTEPRLGESDGINGTKCRWDMLLGIYVCWFIIFVVDVVRWIYQVQKDKDFVKDINNEMITDLEEVEKHTPELQKRRLKTRLTVCGPSLSVKIIKTDLNRDIIASAKSERFKKAKARETFKPFDFDFSPGML